MLRAIFGPRLLLLAVLSWAIPFLAAFAFFTPEGVLAIPQPLFKSLMVVIGTGTGAVLLALAYRRLVPSAGAGLLLGLVWLLVNWGLDVAILLPMSGQPLAGYAADTGLRYLSLPIIAMAIGQVAGRIRAHGH